MEPFAPSSVPNQPPFLTVDIVDASKADKVSMPTPSPTIMQSPTSIYLELPPSSLRRSSSSGSTNTAFDVSPTIASQDNMQPGKSWTPGDPFYETPEKLKEPPNNPWEIAYSLRDQHDKGMCAAWRDEIDKLIIFAGLFSAVVVAFLAISYPMLQPNPSVAQNQFYVALYRVWDAAYTANLNGNVLDIQLPAPPNPPPSTLYQPPFNVLRLNAVWFLSLTLSLSMVLVGIVCLQWIREYERDTRRGPKEGFAVRQMRFDGLEHWGVPIIIHSLPIIFQSSLLLFLWGLLEFLWTLNHIITMINTIIIALIFFFVFATISLPTFQCVFSSCERMRHGHQCAYKSPQARIFALAVFSILIPIIKLLQVIKGRNFLQKKLAFLARFTRGRDWVPFDNAWNKLRLVRLPGTQEVESYDLPQGLAWLATTYTHKKESLQTLHHFMRNLHPSTSLNALKNLNIPKIQKLQPDWSAIPRHDSILVDILSAFLLAHQVEINTLRAYPLLNRRVELLVRIANYSLAVQSTEETTPIRTFIDDCLSEELDCAFNPFSPEYDYSTLPNAFKKQLLMTNNNYLTSRILNPVVWSIIKPMAFQIIASANDANPLVPDLSSLNRQLENYFRNSKDRAKLELKPAFDFMRYIFPFETNIEGDRFLQHREFFKTLWSFKSVLKRHVEDCAQTANFLSEVDLLMTSNAESAKFREYFDSFYQTPVNGRRFTKPRRLSTLALWSPFRQERRYPRPSRALSVPLTTSKTI